MLSTPEPNVWIVASVVLAVCVFVAASYFVYTFLSRRWMRRSIMHLIGYRERITASRKTLETVVDHLLSGSESTLLSFASNSADDNRRALSETGARMLITRDELDIRRLHPLAHRAAEELADVAHVIALCALPYEGDISPGESLDALSAINLKAVAEQYRIADTLLAELAIAYDVDESVVYGGGLYI